MVPVVRGVAYLVGSINIIVGSLLDLSFSHFFLFDLP